MQSDGGGKPIWSLALMSSVILSLLGCSAGGGESASAPAPAPAPVPSAAPIQPGTPMTVNLPANQSFLASLNVGTASAFMLIADGGSGNGPVISSLTSPSGQTLVTPDPLDEDPIGKTSAATPVNPVNAILFPQTPLNGITAFTSPDAELMHNASSSTNAITGGAGVYTVSILNQNSQPQTIRLHGIVNQRSNPTGGTIQINFILCGHPNFTIAAINNAVVRSPFIDAYERFKMLWASAGLTVQDADVRLFECDAQTKARFGFIFSSADIEALHRLTGQIPNQGLNFAFVDSISLGGTGTILGISAGIPGPALLQGTAASGVLLATGGDPALWNVGRRTQVGNAMAHEGGHFLGLSHPTERCGTNPSMACDPVLRALPAWFHVDPIPDTPACPSSLDTNNNGLLSPQECGATFGGTNVMFWQSEITLEQNQWTAGQRFVLHRNPFAQ